MPFVTKVDYSNNRQVKQFQLTSTALSGTTVFGLDYSGLTSGVDASTIVNTGSYSNVVSSFSGNLFTTVFTFGEPDMNAGSVTLVPITSSNSGTTQNGYGFEGTDATIIDGNTVYGAYTGSSYDLTVTTIIESGVNQWSGRTISTTVGLLSGSSTDFSNRTIWVDVKGLTRTKRLILSDELEFRTGDTVTILGRDSSGNVVGVELSGVTGTTGGDIDDYTTGATFNTLNGIVTFTRLSGGTYNVDIDGRYLPLSGFSSYTGSTTGTDDYTTGATFNVNNGVITYNRLSGGTYNVDIDGRYLPISGFTAYTGSTQALTDNDDYTISSTFNTSNGIATFTRLSGGTYTLPLDGRYLLQSDYVDNNDYLIGGTFDVNNDIIDFDMASGDTVSVYIGGRYVTLDNLITGVTVTGGVTKTITLTNRSGGTISDTWIDLDDVVTGMTFNTNNGILELRTLSGDTITEDLDGRYLPLSAHTDDYTTGSTFNSGTGILEFTRQSGGTYNVDISAYSGSTNEFIGLTDTPSTYSGSAYNLLAVNSGETAVEFVQAVLKAENQGNGTGYAWANRDESKYTNIGNAALDLSFVAGTASDYGVGSPFGFAHGEDHRLPITGGTSGNFGGHFTFGYGNRVEGYYGNAAIGAYNTVLDGYNAVTFGYSNSMNMTATVGHGFSVGGFNNSTSYWNNAFGFDLIVKSKGTTVVGLSNTDYAISAATDPTRPVFVVGAGNAVSSAGPTYGNNVFRADALMVKFNGEITAPITSTNDINNAGGKSLITLEYLTGYTASGGTGGANTDDYTTGATFDNSNGLITFTRQSGSTYNVDIDGRYLTLSAFTSYTGSTTGTDDYVTGATFDTLTGDLDLVRQSGGTITVNLDDRYQPIHLNINQTAHGFSIGDAVRFDGTNYTLAIADSPDHSSVIGLVSKSADTNNFSIQTSGVFTGSTWTSGVDYFLSTSVSGSVVTEPTYLYNQVRQYIGTALSTSQLLLSIDLGDEVTEFLDNYIEDLSVVSPHNIDWYYETHRLTLTGNTTLTDSNLPTSGIYSKAITLYVDGNFTLTLPTAWQTYVTGTYDGATLNQIVVEYIKTGLYWVDINRAD